MKEIYNCHSYVYWYYFLTNDGVYSFARGSLTNLTWVQHMDKIDIEDYEICEKNGNSTEIYVKSLNNKSITINFLTSDTDFVFDQNIVVADKKSSRNI